jgi:elongation factor Ts
VLLDQPSVTDNKTPVARQVADAGLTIKRFARFEASGA